MAIQWGSYGYVTGAVRGRVGVDLSIAYPGGALDKTDTQATITGKVYFQLEHPYYGNGINARVEITGDHTQTTEGISWSVGSGGSDLLLTFTDTTSLTYGSSWTYDVTARVRAATTWAFTPSKKATIKVPARPYYDPAAPTSLSVSRSSDTRQNVSWTRNATTAAPYGNVEVWRNVNGGSFSRIANLSGTATSYADTSTVADRRYGYRVRATNSAGSSAYSATDYISTTPKTPAAPTATKKANGDIVVTRPALSSVASTWEVKEVGGSTLATGIPASTSTWTHVNPNPAATWTYAIRAVSTDPTLYSGYSANSNTVQLQTPPAAPTGLAPNGGVRDAAEAIALTWAYNSIDTSEQTQYQLRYRVQGSSTWTSPAGVLSGDQIATIPADTWTNGQVIEWEVRTWGAHVDPSPWSATATFTLSTPPVVGVTSPTSGQVIDQPSHTFEWSYFQAEGRAQASWQVELWRGNTLQASADDGGTNTSWNSGPVLQNGQTYTFRVRVYDNIGTASEWDEVTFTVNYTPPLEPGVQGQWYDEGFVMLQLTPVSDGVAPETTSFTIERQIDGGPWVTLVTDLPTDTEYLDRTAAPNGTNTYRVTAVSDLPSMASTTYDVVTTQKCYLYLNGGPGLAVIVRLRVIRSRSLTTGRRRVLNEYSGRFAPVETSGQMVPWAMSVSATMMPSGGCSSVGQSDVDELETLFGLPGPHLMRDGQGRYETVTLSDLDADLLYLGDVSFTMTRSSPATSEQLAAIMAYVGPVLTEGPLGEYHIVGGTTTSGDQGEWTWTP